MNKPIELDTIIPCFFTCEAWVKTIQGSAGQQGETDQLQSSTFDKFLSVHVV